MEKEKKHKMIIELPKDKAYQLSELAVIDGRQTKPYAERIILAHIDRKLKPKKI